jgi:hypothetical protein
VEWTGQSISSSPARSPHIIGDRRAAVQIQISSRDSSLFRLHDRACDVTVLLHQSLTVLPKLWALVFIGNIAAQREGILQGSWFRSPR